MTQKLILFVVLSGAWLGFLGYNFLQRPEDEKTVVARLRKAKTITVETKLQRGSSGLEPLNGDHDGLAKTFRVLGRSSPQSAPRSSVAIYDLDDTSNQLICWFFPPDIVNIDTRLYKVDPAFWPALLERTPKMKEWLDKRQPGAVQEAPPKRKSMQKPKAPRA